MTTSHEPGHEFIYRLTAFDGIGQPVESAYYVSPYKVAAWRDRLRAAGYTVVATRVPASAFTDLTDAELDVLMEKERKETWPDSK